MTPTERTRVRWLIFSLKCRAGKRLYDGGAELHLRGWPVGGPADAIQLLERRELSDASL